MLIGHYYLAYVVFFHGQPWKPQFFEKVDGTDGEGETMWKLKGKGGYWERRGKKDWSGVQDVFEL